MEGDVENFTMGPISDCHIYICTAHGVAGCPPELIEGDERREIVQIKMALHSKLLSRGKKIRGIHFLKSTKTYQGPLSLLPSVDRST